MLDGLPMLDNGEVDDKIIAVLSNDRVWEVIDASIKDYEDAFGGQP